MRRADNGSIGGRIAYIRASRSQVVFAGLLGIPIRTYQNYERDLREPDLRCLSALLELGWNTNWILTGEGPEKLAALPVAASADSQVLRIDREILARAEKILTLALEIARVEVGPELHAGFLADVYEHLMEIEFSPNDVREITRQLTDKLFEIQGSRDAKRGSGAGAEIGSNTGALERK